MLRQSIGKLILGLSVMLALPSSAFFAHVKWFVPMEDILGADLAGYSQTDSAVLIWIGLAVFMIAASIFLV